MALRCTALVVALFSVQNVLAGPILPPPTPITFTGHVATDFGYNAAGTESSNPYVTIIPHSNTPAHIAQPQWMTNSGFVSGWNVNNIAVEYDAKNDTLYVGIKTFGIAGNVDGNGTPGNPDPRLIAAGGTDPANFGGDKAMAIGIAPFTHAFTAQNPPAPTIVAGISGDKSQTGSGLDGFTVAKYAPIANAMGPNYDLVRSFGQPITGAAGSSLAFDPSGAHPGFEFSIAHFSKVLGADPTKGIVVNMQDGSVNSVVTGKDYVPSIVVTFPEPQNIPEPATGLAWVLVAGLGGAWLHRRRKATPH
jgi:MYXO-CTERM domain-containing protein